MGAARLGPSAWRSGDTSLLGDWTQVGSVRSGQPDKFCDGNDVTLSVPRYRDHLAEAGKGLPRPTLQGVRSANSASRGTTAQSRSARRMVGRGSNCHGSCVSFV